MCGSTDVRLWSAGLGGALCPACADQDAAAVSPDVLALLAHLATADLTNAGRVLDVGTTWSDG